MKSLLTLIAACALASLALGATAHPRWAVRVSSDGFAYFIDQPNCHPLTYFLNDTARLNYQKHWIIHIKPGKTNDEAQSRPVGEVAGWKILEVRHKINGGRLFLRLLLIERRAGEFCEIYHQEWMGDPDNFLSPLAVYREVLAPYLVKAGSETLLAVRDPASGNGYEFDEHYWSFDKNGPIDLGVDEVIRDVEKRLLPENWTITKGDGFNAERLTYTAAPLERTSGRYGILHIRFALKDHRLVVVSQNFSPNWKPKP